MPRPRSDFPAYRRHRPSGQAVVTIAGDDHYLGKFGSPASRKEYDRLVMEWTAAGRPQHGHSVNDLTIVELCFTYLKFAKGYYTSSGRTTGEIHPLKAIIKTLREHYGETLAKDFGPLALKALRQRMIELGGSRGTINKQVSRIRRIFRWGASEQLLATETYQALATVDGLRLGRSNARETLPIRPVDDDIVEATQVKLPPVVADMVRLQRLTGCRPDEVCKVRPCDVDTSGPVWAYRPHSHKTKHRGRERVIFIGPKGQDVLRPYLLRDKNTFCFCPAEGERKRRAKNHELRRTRLSQGNRPGTNRKDDPQWAAGDHYTSESYRRAIHRACELAFGMSDELRKIPKDLPGVEKARRRELAKRWRAEHTWHPNQLRHSAATEIRKRFGLEAAQVP